MAVQGDRLRPRGIRRGSRRLAFAAVLAATLAVTACQATQEEPSTSALDRVLEAGTLRVGVVADIPPHGFYDDNNEFDGLDLDIAELMASDLGVDLEVIVLPDLAARVSSVVAGDVDMVIGATFPTPERAQQVAFSTGYAPSQEVLLGRAADTDLLDYRDYGGRTVAIVTGSTQEVITRLNPEIEALRVGDVAASRQAFLSGQADAFVVGHGTAAEYIAEDPTLAHKGVLSSAVTAIALPRNDPEWLRFVNNSLQYHGGQGTLAALYRERFGHDMPRLTPQY